MSQERPASYQMVFKRTEAKYLLDDAQRARLEGVMGQAMSPDSFGVSTVRNLYLDTPTLLLARRSIERPTYKEKVRIRSYAPATGGEEVFLELKKKFKGVVYKRRCVVTLDEALALCDGTRDPRDQVELELSCTARREGGLRPVSYLAYDREAFYATDDHDFRMTFDRNVRARWDSLDLATDGGERLLDEGVSILEVKTSKAIPLWLVDFLSEEGLRKASFSKYGTAYRMRYPGGWRPEASAYGKAREPAAAPGRRPATRKPSTLPPLSPAPLRTPALASHAAGASHARGPLHLRDRL